jgi:2-amino-4-hydroxy-6-hydroxymethyldihydropteridine diphosphokinase
MILIAVGANLPTPSGHTPFETCVAAVEEIRQLDGLRFVALSSWYRSIAIPRAEQPSYCNGVVRLDGEPAALKLLHALQAIELKFGRQRSWLNESRTLDLDIIDLNGAIRATPPPILPHPRAHLRAFVLRPIMDVAPSWRHPTLRQSVSSLLSELPPQGIEPWNAD